LAVGSATAQPSLDAPSPANFGVKAGTGEVVAIDRAPRGAPWPSQTSYTVPVEKELLPTPAAQDFIYYSRKFAASFGAPPDRKAARQNLAVTSKLAPKPGPSKILALPKDPKGAGAATRTHPIGHQLTVTKPTASATDALRLGLR
jgi:hypothetical protein